MRALQISLILAWCALGCSSSSPAPAAADDAGGTNGDLDSSYSRPDGRITFGEGGARTLYGVGEQCMHGADCLAGGCNQDADGFPGGYCVGDCGGRFGGPVMCPANATCTTINADTPTCYKTCSSDADCRVSEGYYCLDVGAMLVMSGGEKICYPKATPPNCNFNQDCPPSLPTCTGGYVPPEAGAAEAGMTSDDGGFGGGGFGAGDGGRGGRGGRGGPPRPGMGTCGP
jgi:hypothetical protein